MEWTYLQMFVLKDDDDVDEERYGPIFLGDPITDRGYFDEPPLCVLFIVCKRFVTSYIEEIYRGLGRRNKTNSSPPLVRYSLSSYSFTYVISGLFYTDNDQP